jgi:hypothetical protein
MGPGSAVFRLKAKATTDETVALSRADSDTFHPANPSRAYSGDARQSVPRYGATI